MSMIKQKLAFQRAWIDGREVFGDELDQAVKDMAAARSALFAKAKKAGISPNQLEGVTYDSKLGKFRTIPNHTGD